MTKVLNIFILFISYNYINKIYSFINKSVKIKNINNMLIFNDKKINNENENNLKKLNSKNKREQTKSILNNRDYTDFDIYKQKQINYDEESDDESDEEFGEDGEDQIKKNKKIKNIELIITKEPLDINEIKDILNNPQIIKSIEENDEYKHNLKNSEDEEMDINKIFENNRKKKRNLYYKNDNTRRDKVIKSDNFEVITNFTFNFKDIGGYDEIKDELLQSIDVLMNIEKYSKYNVRIPKGIVLEGPPGNGKTLLVKGLSGEAKLPLICCSGSEFQEKFVGVGSSRIRELFALAEKNIPCIIFIDEIDAIGRKRAEDGEISSAERDSTLNQLLVSLDGYKTKQGIFLIAATNRFDLLDKALTRPGRIDKKIYIGFPDSYTRREIIKLHIKGKPYDETINIEDLVDYTDGLSGSEIENVLNEGMLNALRRDNEVMNIYDIDVVYNKMIGGYQNSKDELDDKMIEQICVHEIGHVLVGLFCKNHSKVKKVILNLNSPKNLGYTLFEKLNKEIQNYQSLIEHIMILLGGRIAEEIIYGSDYVSIGAISDFEESIRLSNSMILNYGFGKNVLYPYHSDKNKEMVDEEIMKIINTAYNQSTKIISDNKPIIMGLAKKLKEKKTLNYDEIITTIKKIKNENNIYDFNKLINFNGIHDIRNISISE